MSSRAARLLALAVPIIVLGVTPAAATISRLGADFALDPEVSCSLSDPQLAALTNGDVVAVWRTEQGVWARRFDSQGAPRFPYATQIASGYAHELPRVAPLAGGGFAIAWFDATRRIIVVRRADAAGHLGAPVDVIPVALGSGPTDLALRAGAGGRLGIASTVHSFPYGATYFREMGVDGTPTSPVIEVGAYGYMEGDDFVSYSPVLLSAEDGSYALSWILWQRGIGGTPTRQGFINARRLRPPFTQYPEEDIVVPGYPVATSLTGALAADGSYLLAWTTPGNPPAATARVEAQRMSALDQPLGARIAVESGKPFVDGIAAAASPEGGFAIAWEGPPPPAYSGQIFLRLLREDGSTDGPVETASTSPVLESATAASVVFLPDGQLVVSWNASQCDLCDPPPCLAERLRAQRFAVGCEAGGPGVLCLGDGRFQATLSYSDPRRGIAGTATGVPLTSDTGYFWFFAQSNLEVLVKVLDGRALNGHYWVFWGGVTDLGFHLTVHDTVTGATRTYDSPAGTFASAADTRALPAATSVAAGLGDEAELKQLNTVGLDQQAFTAPAALADLVPEIAPATAAARVHGTDTSGGASPCTHPSLPVVPRPGLCLAGHRFEVEATWDDATHQGVAQGLPLSDDTGLFWFFSPSNVELVVKVLDGRPVNGRFWVFYGALTNVAYDLVVRHAEDGTEWRRHSAGGNFGSGADTGALQPPACACPGVYELVCGRDGRVYGNTCEVYCFGWASVDPTSTPPQCAGN